MYNRRAYIRRAIESVLAQSHSDFELIVVDDGSTDECSTLVRGCRDTRVRLVSQSNAGAGAARNRGILEAESDWVAFLDSDDEWLPGFLEQCVSLATLNPEVGAVFTNIRSTVPDKPWLALQFASPRVLDDYFALAVQNRGRGMTSSSVMVRKQALKSIGGFPVGVHRSEDLDTWLRLAITFTVGCVPEVLAVYHTETAGSVALFPEPFFPEAVRTLRRFRREGRIPKQFMASLARLENIYLLIYARDLLVYGDRVRAATVLFRECALEHSPPQLVLRAIARLLVPPRE